MRRMRNEKKMLRFRLIIIIITTIMTIVIIIIVTTTTTTMMTMMTMIIITTVTIIPVSIAKSYHLTRTEPIKRNTLRKNIEKIYVYDV